MPSLKFTEKKIDALPAPDPSGRQVIYWDEELTGFGVLCSGKTRAKTFIVQRRLPDGRTRRVTIGPTNVFTDIAVARKEAEGKLADLYRGKDPKAARRANMTLRKALDEYLEARTKLRPKSKTIYRSLIERHLESWLDRPLRDINADMVEGRHREIQKEVVSHNKKDREAGRVQVTGGGSANLTMRTFRAIFNFVSDRASEMPPNPVRRLRESWYDEPRRERLVRADELPAFYDAVCALPSRTHCDYVLTLLFTGLRKSEAGALKWSEVDLVGRMIRLPAGRTKAGRKLDLPMSDFVRDLFIARRALGNEGDYVFACDSKSGHLENPGSAFGEIEKATGIVLSPHDLRRTFITVAEATDMSVIALKALVNHSIGSDVTSGYVRLTVDRLREPAQRICDRLKTLCGIEAVVGENVEGIGKISALP